MADHTFTYATPTEKGVDPEGILAFLDAIFVLAELLLPIVVVQRLGVVRQKFLALFQCLLIVFL